MLRGNTIQDEALEAVSSIDNQPADPPVIGKEELLAWVREVLGERGKDVSFSTLRFGDVFLHLFALIWPNLSKELPIYRNEICENAMQVNANWNAIENTLLRVDVPLTFVSQSRIRIADFQACYQALVLLYFLYSLAKDHQCEFVLAYPVDPALTDFMSSEAPLACLVAGGAVSLPVPIRDKIMTPRMSMQTIGISDCNLINNDKMLTIHSNDHKQELSNDLPKYLPNEEIRQHTEDVRESTIQQQFTCSVSPRAEKDATAAAAVATAAVERPTVLPSASSEIHSTSQRVVNRSSTSSNQPLYIGGAFTKDGTFCSESGKNPQMEISRIRRNDKNKEYRDAEIQVQGEEGEIQLLDRPSNGNRSIEWCGEGHKVKGEQLIEMLRYQNEKLQQQLLHAEEEASARRRHHMQEIADLKEAAAVELQRWKEKCNADMLDQQTRHHAAIQALRHQLDMRIRQMEDDVSIDIEVLSSSSSLASLMQRDKKEDADDGGTDTGTLAGKHCVESTTALKKVRALEKLMEERLRSRDAANKEMKQLLEDTQQQCASYRRESDARWCQWKRCEELKESLLQLIPKAGELLDHSLDSKDSLTACNQAINEQVLQVLDSSGISTPPTCVLERKLLSALVQSISLQHALQARHRQEEIQLIRIAQQQQQSVGDVPLNNGSLASMHKELLLEEQVRRLEVHNQRLIRTCEYLRLKVEHIEKWKTQDEIWNQNNQMAAHSQTQSLVGSTCTSDKPFKGDILGEKDIPCFKGEMAVKEPLLLHPPPRIDAIDRDAELLHVLKNLNRRGEDGLVVPSTDNCDPLDTSEITDTKDIVISVSTKKRLMQLFWLLLGDFYRFKARLEEGNQQMLHMQQVVRWAIEQKLAAEQAAEREKNELVCSFETRIQKDRSAFQKTIGRTLVKFMAAQEQVQAMQKVMNKHEDDHEAMLQVLHQADNKRFSTILAKLHSVEVTNRILHKREHFWSQLAKALSTQLTNPSEETQQSVQDLWSQLMGSRVLLKSGLLELSFGNSGMQQIESNASSKEGGSTARSLCPRPAWSSSKTTSAKLNARYGVQPSMRCLSKTATASRTQGKQQRRVTPGGQGIRLRGPSSEQQPTEETGGSCSAAADSFTRCLREISGQTSWGEKQEEASKGINPSSSLSTNEALLPTSDSEDEIVRSNEAIGAAVLPWIKNIATDVENCKEMPKDWVDLLKAMAEEGTALIRKHKALKDKEVEELKREREEQAEKTKKLMLQLSDQQTLCTSLREQYDFFQKQHSLALESLQRVQRDKAKMEMAQREKEDALRRESAELRTSQKEAVSVLTLVASHASDIPYIVSLCKSCLSGGPQSQEQTGAESKAPSENKDIALSNESPKDQALDRCALLKEDLLAGRQGLSAESQRRTYHLMESKPAQRSLEATTSTALHTSTSQIALADVHAAPTQQLDEAWENTSKNAASQRVDTGKSVYPTETGTSTNDEEEYDAAHHGSRNNQMAPNHKDRERDGAKDREIDADVPQVCNAKDYSLLRDHQGFVSSAPSSNEVDLLEQEEGDSLWGDEVCRVPSTTLPSPRSPPKAALAPLISPSRLMHALRMHARTPKSIRSDGKKDYCSSSQSNEDMRVSSSARVARQSDSYETEVAAPPRQTPLSVESISSSLSTSNRKIPKDSPGSHVSTAEDSKQQLAARHAIGCEASVASLDAAEGKSNEVGKKYRCENEGKDITTQRSSSRAAAEKAWEAFVEEYGHSSREQQESTQAHMRIQGWNSLKIPGSANRANILQGGSERKDLGPSLAVETETGGLGVFSVVHLNEEDTTCLTRETTDSALQDVLKIEQGLKDEDVRISSNDLKERGNLTKTDSDDVFISDDTNQLGITASSFLRRLGSQLESRMRISCKSRQSNV